MELAKKRHNIITKDTLGAEILEVWNNIPGDFISGLYESLPHRIKKVIKMKGNMTKY